MVKFEFLGTDPAYPGSKIYDVEAIHVTTSGNGRKYTKDELEEATLSLAFRPLDINHDSSRILTYPDNETLMAHFDGHSIKTRIRVVDPVILKKIESGAIRNVSVSQVSNETCADSMCRTKLQYGMAFTRLALLEDMTPGDQSARIIKMESIADLIKCDSGCKCDKCTKTENYHCPDCHKEFGCKDELKKHMMSEHGKSEYDSGCVSDCLKAKADAGHEIDDQAKAICISECSKDEVVNSHNTDKDKNKEMTESKDKKESLVTPEPATVNAAGQDATKLGVQTKTPDIGDTRNDAASTEKQIQKDTPDIHAMEPRYWEEFKDQNQKQLDKLTELIGAVNFNAVKPKNEPTTPSTKVDDTPKTSKKDEYENVVKFFEDIKTHPRSSSQMGITWTADKEDYLRAHGYLSQESLRAKMEASNSVTTTNTFGINFSKQVLLVPGGRMKTPVRQYCQVVLLDGQDTANFYTINSLAFAGMTEGTVPSASTQTVTRVQAVPSLVGALELIGYSQIENAPYNLVDAVNEANILAGIDAEAIDVLDTVYDAAGTKTNAVNANTGAALANAAYDDVAGMTFKRDGIVGGKRLIMKEGYDGSPGSLVLFIHPKAWQDLMLDTNMNNYYQWANPSITALGELERLYGVDIVVSDQVTAKDNTTNDTHRNVLATKGRTFGLATGRDVLLEAQRRNEIQQVMVTGTQRTKGAVIDEKSSCQISSAQ